VKRRRERSTPSCFESGSSPSARPDALPTETHRHPAHRLDPVELIATDPDVLLSVSVSGRLQAWRQ
jgi:hypothetical protein